MGAFFKIFFCWLNLCLCNVDYIAHWPICKYVPGCGIEFPNQSVIECFITVKF